MRDLALMALGYFIGQGAVLALLVAYVQYVDRKEFYDAKNRDR